MSAISEHKDFLISYSPADQRWAEWIAWQLEDAGYTTHLEAWDLRPGDNRVLRLDIAIQTAQRIIALLSPDYLHPGMTSVVWATAFQRDPTGQHRLLIPVRVRPCEVQGLLGQFELLDLVDLDQSAARDALLEGILAERGKPRQAPTYPSPHFPGTLPTVWMVPFRRNRLFTGREGLLRQISEALLPGHPVALTQAVSGLGGIGKTQTVIEYAYRTFQQYQAVFWIRADTQQSITASFLRIAEALGLPVQKEKETEQIIRAVQRWCRLHRDWLLIVDGADDLELLQNLLPEGNGYILLTTRSQITRGMADKTIPLDVMEADEAILLLLRCAKCIQLSETVNVVSQQDREAALQIVEELGALPLALDQAGAYIEETQCSLVDYLALYRQYRSFLLKRRGTLVQNYPSSVATTWSLSFERVEQRSTAAADLLRLCAFLSVEAIPEEIIVGGKDVLPPSLQTIASDPLAFNEAISAVLAYSLLRRDVAAHTLTMHRLVQAALADAMDEQTKRQWTAYAVLAVSRTFPEASLDTWPQCERLLPHVLLFFNTCEQDICLEEKVRLFTNAGGYLGSRSRYREAEPLYRQALAIQEQHMGPMHLETARNLDSLALFYVVQGKDRVAEPLYQRALGIRKKQLGSRHPDTALSLDNLAGVYAAQGKYREAEPLYRCAHVAEKTLLQGRSITGVM